MGQGSSSSSLSTFKDTNNGVNHDLTLSLPDECLALVFGKLNNTQDKNTISLVSKRWNTIESKSRQTLTLIARFEISQSLPSLFTRFSSISTLSLKCSRKHISINDHSLSQIPPLLSSLKKLKLKGCLDLTDAGIHSFSVHRPPFLAKVSFASCGFGSKGLISVLINCPNLQHLTLKRLRNLDSQNSPIHFQFDDHNCKLQRLSIKDLHNARLFAPILSSCEKTLKTLIVSRSSGNWDPVFNTSFQGRTSVVVSEIRLENVQIGDLGLLAISKSCCELETLYLSRVTDCTDEGLSGIANSCKKLRKLHIDAWSRFGSRSIGDEGVLSVAGKSVNLQEIVLMGVPVTAASLIVLASNCPALDRMALCNTESVGDSEMVVIGAKFNSLKKLCIKNCPISNTGVEAILGGCPSLVKLKVKRCRQVTKAAAGLMRNQRNTLIVSFDYGSMVFDGVTEGDATVNPNPLMVGGSSTIFTRNRSIDMMCSSRGAQILMSKFSRRRSSESEEAAVRVRDRLSSSLI